MSFQTWLNSSGALGARAISSLLGGCNLAIALIRRFHSRLSACSGASLSLKSDIIESEITNGEKGFDNGTCSSRPKNPGEGNGRKPAFILNLESIFVLSIPITTDKSYIYCNHKPSLLSDKQRSEVHRKIKLENNLVKLATKAWNKLENSKVSINKRIVLLIGRLLNSIPYDENSLRSFPRKSTMIREINEEHRETYPKAVMTSALENKAISLDQLKPIPVYHPEFQKPHAILAQMQKFKSYSRDYHRKWAFLCAAGIPLSLPVALVPIVPNVPGFYFAYRLFCHLQALRGAKNLGYLLESNDDTVEDTFHLTFRFLPELDLPYLKSGSADKNKSKDSKNWEKLIINAETIDQIVNSTGLVQIREDLYRALAQESRRLQKVSKSKGTSEEKS